MDEVARLRRKSQEVQADIQVRGCEPGSERGGPNWPKFSCCVCVRNRLHRIMFESGQCTTVARTPLTPFPFACDGQKMSVVRHRTRSEKARGCVFVTIELSVRWPCARTPSAQTLCV